MKKQKYIFLSLFSIFKSNKRVTPDLTKAIVLFQNSGPSLLANIKSSKDEFLALAEKIKPKRSLEDYTELLTVGSEYDQLKYAADRYVSNEERCLVLITSSTFYTKGSNVQKKPENFLKEYKNKNFVYVERSEGNSYEKVSNFHYKIGKKPGDLTQLFIELGLIEKE